MPPAKANLFQPVQQVASRAGRCRFPSRWPTLSVTIGGEAASSILYAGEAPDSVCGLIQINATLPSDLSAGPQPVVLTFGTASNTGQSITVAVK